MALLARTHGEMKTDMTIVGPDPGARVPATQSAEGASLSFMRTHGMASGIGAALGATSGFLSTSFVVTTPEMYLSSNMPEWLDQLAVFLGFSDLAEMLPWWPRDAPVWWMLPLTALFLWFVTIPCSPQGAVVAEQTREAEHQTMLHMRMETAELAVHHAELSTPVNKTFGKLEREAAEKAAQDRIVSQTAADVTAAQFAHDEYQAFLQESRAEWRLLRFQVVGGYLLGWAAAYLLGLGGFLAVPLIALLLPLSLFVVLVSANVLSEWSVYLLDKCMGMEEVAEDEAEGSASWGLALRSSLAPPPGCCASCCASVRACCAALCPPSAAEKWGVQLRQPGKYMPPAQQRVNML